MHEPVRSSRIKFSRVACPMEPSIEAVLDDVSVRRGTFNSSEVLQKAKAARTLVLVHTLPPDRRHHLRGDRGEQFAVDLVHPHRLVFEANHASFLRKDDGGIDVEQVTAITIIEVIDYH